jgi:hypothetical protein
MDENKFFLYNWVHVFCVMNTSGRVYKGGPYRVGPRMVREAEFT